MKINDIHKPGVGVAGTIDDITMPSGSIGTIVYSSGSAGGSGGMSGKGGIVSGNGNMTVVIEKLKEKLNVTPTEQNIKHINVNNEIVEKIRILLDTIDYLIETMGILNSTNWIIFGKDRVVRIDRDYFLSGDISKEDMQFMNVLWTQCNDELSKIKTHAN